MNVAALVPALIAAAFASAPAQGAPPPPSGANIPDCPALEINAAAFSRNKDVAHRTIENFFVAYRAACSRGLFRNHPLVQPGPLPRGKLFLVLKNAPEANVASIYNEGESGARRGRMVLEYPFITADGRTHVPSPDELEEAIFCAVQGATAAEQEEEGRCLVD